MNAYTVMMNEGIRQKSRRVMMRNYRELVTQTIQDPQEATAYLKASLDEYEQDGNLEAFLLALRSVVDVQGGMTELSRKTTLNRQSLYKTLSKQGNPRLHTLHTILQALGLSFQLNLCFQRVWRQKLMMPQRKREVLPIHR